MADCITEIQSLAFDVSDKDITKVTIIINYWGDCPEVAMKRVYENKFPACMSVIEILEKEVPKYLEW